MEEIKYAIGLAAEKDIGLHLRKCDKNFFPALSERVDVDAYGKKLYENAVNFEAWQGNLLVGLIAAYFNENGAAFITSVSVTQEHMRLGVASELMKMCIGYAQQHNVRELKLEVFKGNEKAIRFYKKLHFLSEEIKNDFVQMKLQLSL